MSPTVVRRSLVVAVFFLLVIGVLLWSLIPWGVASEVPEVQARVRPERRPAWTRRPRGVELPPVSESWRPAPATPTVDGDTDTDELAGTALVSGWVVDDQGRNVPEGWIELRCDGYGRRLEADEQGWFELDLQAPASCTVIGYRRDGLLLARSAPLSMELVPGEDLEFDLIVPASRTGGVGVTIGEHEYGIEAVLVHEGTPAWEAGLRPGDVITQVEGRDAVDLSPDDFVQVMTGPEGSNVSFRALVRDEDGAWVEEEFAVVRRFLSSEMIR